MYYYKGNPSKLPYTLALFDFPQNGSHLMIPMGFGHAKHDETLISISVPASKSLSEGTGEGPGVSGSTRAGEAERSVEGRSKRLTESCESPGGSFESFGRNYLHPPRVSNFSCQVCFWWLMGAQISDFWEDSGRSKGMSRAGTDRINGDGTVIYNPLINLYQVIQSDLFIPWLEVT